MNLQLLPGIAWALDERSLEWTRKWWQGLPPRAQTVFQVAGSWEEFAEILLSYRYESFDDTLLKAQLSLTPQINMRRINVVILSSFPCPDQVSWARVEENLTSLWKENVSLEYHRVLLHQVVPALGVGPTLKETDFDSLTPVGGLPWLLSRVLSGGFILEEESFFKHFSLLLDVLFLSEREGGQAPDYVIGSFFRTPHQPGKIRLAGFSRLDLNLVLEDMASLLTQGIFSRAYHLSYKESYAELDSFRHRLAQLVGEFLAGKVSVTQVENFLFGEKALPSLPIAAILREIPDILEQEARRLGRPENLPPPAPGWFARLWRKILSWLGRGETEGSHQPDLIPKDHLIGQFAQFSGFLRELAAQTRKDKGHGTIPPERVQEWSEEFLKLIHRGLQSRWAAAEVKERLAKKIGRDTLTAFLEALSRWELKAERVLEMAKALEEGDLLRFSAPLRGGLPILPQAVVTSFNLGKNIPHGTENVSCATLRFYPGRPPVLLAASQPVEGKHLNL